jgi:hypothetical protein
VFKYDHNTWIIKLIRFLSCHRVSPTYEPSARWPWGTHSRRASQTTSLLRSSPVTWPPGVPESETVPVQRCPTLFKVSSRGENRRQLRGTAELNDPFAALLIYVSAIFIVKGYYDFSTMMQVYSLVLFSVTFASQFMDFSE